ncbi:MAG TPA: sigma-54 dependent transcriptional regulator [Bacteroidales bacterium]|nr:sigma-54 dependent transcriptional regulator [Bacteroidales bacterium]
MNSNVQAIKQRFGIIGFDPMLDHAIYTAIQVAPTELSVLITGESGVGKENFPKIIHENSAHKHGQYIAVNCGAIPEGTIDSELFGHEKGSFTGAAETRKGYFEVANGGTIFLDEVADLPLATQVRLLRVLENGEYFKVGSSIVQKTNVRVVAATNINIVDRIAKGKFREDLYYRLNTIPIQVPPLRDRKNDIFLLFTKFASDFAQKYRVPSIQLTDEAVEALKTYNWPGNIRQLRNVTEQISIIESIRLIEKPVLQKYLVAPQVSHFPVLVHPEMEQAAPGMFEREIIYKFLGDLKREVAELKKIVTDMKGEKLSAPSLRTPLEITDFPLTHKSQNYEFPDEDAEVEDLNGNEQEMMDDQFSLIEAEKELIKKALEKHNNKRKLAADELGISERTLYRKIREYEIGS